MPLNYFFCKKCKKRYRAFTKTKKCECGLEAERVINAPGTSFYAPHCAESKMVGRSSVLKGVKEDLKERSNEDNRQNMDDFIQNNPMEVSERNQWVNEKGQTRKKVEDK